MDKNSWSLFFQIFGILMFSLLFLIITIVILRDQSESIIENNRSISNSPYQELYYDAEGNRIFEFRDWVLFTHFTIQIVLSPQGEFKQYQIIELVNHTLNWNLGNALYGFEMYHSEHSLQNLWDKKINSLIQLAQGYNP